jgi:photosynthetic reaction center H subunit
MTATFFGNVDIALISLYAFFLFFFGLVIYLQRENQLEGYPLEDDDGNLVNSNLPLRAPKTFILPNRRGEVVVGLPDDRETRTFAMEQVARGGGFPFQPTGDPMKDGVGPAAYALRRDEPEYDGHNEPKIQPMSKLPDYTHHAGKDPRGMPVIAGDGEVVGTVSDMWLDKPEMLVRYLEIDLGGAGKRLVPIALSRITWKGVVVRSIYAEHFPGVPSTASDAQVTKLEEDKICAYYAGGTLYAARSRTEPQLEGAEA